MPEPLGKTQVLAPDRVLLLLSLGPYLREHGPVPVAELAETFQVPAPLLRKLVRFLGTAGVPGETLSYQDEDLFDIDWDALEFQDLVSITRTVAVDDAPRFAPAETAALIAGLHALTAVLPEEDAALARATATKLASALGANTSPSLSVSADPQDALLPTLIAAIESRRVIRFTYRDAAGVTSLRTVEPRELMQGTGAWYLRGFCRDRLADRTFRVDQITTLESGEVIDRASALAVEAVGADDSSNGASGDVADEAPLGGARQSSSVEGIVLRASERALSRLTAFRPEVIGVTAAGETRVRVEAWHRDTAIRLVQLAPGEISVESPAAARAAVRAWAERGLAAYGE